VVYLLGVVVVAIVWGFRLAAATCVVSVLAFDFFHIPPLFSLSPTASGDWVTVTVCLVVALAASTLSELARLRAAEADQRRWAAEASRDELRMLADQQAALRRSATLVAHAVALRVVLGRGRGSGAAPPIAVCGQRRAPGTHGCPDPPKRMIASANQISRTNVVRKCLGELGICTPGHPMHRPWPPRVIVSTGWRLTG
jgi:hypothetical protein